MKKILKRISTAILILCLTVPCFAMFAYAAEGTLQFSDPSAAAGDSVTITAKVTTAGSAIGDTDISVTYDSTILKFVSGTNATADGDGKVKLSAKGDGTAAESAYTMEFTALKEGTTTVQASEYKAYLYSDEALNLAEGNSTVTIQGGTPVADTGSGTDAKASTDGGKVDIDGKTYTINENFTEAAIPNGFKAGELELDGIKRKVMVQDSSSQYMFYLDDADGNSDYYLYSTDDGSFSMTEVVDVSSSVSIYLMNHKDKEGLPSQFKETTTDINGKEFSAWQNTSDQDYYLLYALSSEGTTGYYQYDSAEQTYQRYVIAKTSSADTANTLQDKVINFVKAHFVVIICVVAAIFLIFLILMIVLAVKLSHRNQELDDLYDEYGIDDEQSTPEPAKPVKKSKKKQPQPEEDNDFETDSEGYYDDFDEYEDEDEDDSDEYYDDQAPEDDSFETYAEEDSDEYLDDDSDEFLDDDSDDSGEYYDDDEGFYDDDDDLDDRQASGKRNKGKSKEDKDDFSLDFIDL